MDVLFTLFIYRRRQIQRTWGGSTTLCTGNLIFDKNIMFDLFVNCSSLRLGRRYFSYSHVYRTAYLSRLLCKHWDMYIVGHIRRTYSQIVGTPGSNKVTFYNFIVTNSVSIDK